MKTTTTLQVVVLLLIVLVVSILYLGTHQTISAADTPHPITIHLSGNEQGQSVLVHATAWGQVVVTLYNERGHVEREEYTPLEIDADTTSVMVDVCGDNVYLVESGDTIRHYHLELPSVAFECCDRNFTLWVPMVAK